MNVINFIVVLLHDLINFERRKSVAWAWLNYMSSLEAEYVNRQSEIPGMAKFDLMLLPGNLEGATPSHLSSHGAIVSRMLFQPSYWNQQHSKAHTPFSFPFLFSTWHWFPSYIFHYLFIIGSYIFSIGMQIYWRLECFLFCLLGAPLCRTWYDIMDAK